jgi:nucleotide-binding universal stress UspA family protein
VVRSATQEVDMTEVVIGTTSDEGSNDAAALGLALARTVGAVPVVAHVRPEAWQVVGAGRVDAEWDRYLDESSHAVVAATVDRHAVAMHELGAVTDVGRHRSSGIGLEELAVRRGSDFVVIGSAPGGVRGRIVSGSTAEHLLHGSSVPVALAPLGYADAAPERLGRLVVAIETTQHQAQLAPVVQLARHHGLAVVFVSIVRRTTRIYTTQLGADAEDEVLAVLRADAEQALAAALAVVPPVQSTHASGEVLVGDDVTAALMRFAWRPDDLMVCGSSTLGVVRRVLLGDMTFRILRGSPAPVLVMPRA